jgi:hypothetical protein
MRPSSVLLQNVPTGCRDRRERAEVRGDVYSTWAVTGGHIKHRGVRPSPRPRRPDSAAGQQGAIWREPRAQHDGRPLAGQVP